MMMREKTAVAPTTLVIFGISGDLSRRKLLPALSALENAHMLPPDFQIVGLSRRSLVAGDVLTKQCACLKKYLHLLQMDMDIQADYNKIKSALPPGAHTIFYLAIPPTAVLPTISRLGEAGLNGPSVKLLLEKPFGTDLPSAQALIDEISQHFNEPQVFRIDHYLAKEAAQNIAVFLGGNAVFRDVWNKDYIEKIEIFASEKIGIEGRADFWETTGTLRDFVQSHILQLAALILMEPCDDFSDVERLPALRLAALEQIKIDPVNVVRGQYQDYKKETGRKDSRAETFVALRAESLSPRWLGVPIFMATGKKLKNKNTYIRIYFRRINGARGNILTLNIQPREGITFDLWVKQPGPERKIQKLPLSFKYGHYYKSLPDAYEQVLLDAFRSNKSLFASSKEVLASWRAIQPIIETWEKSSKDLFSYPAGTPLEKLVEKL